MAIVVVYSQPTLTPMLVPPAVCQIQVELLPCQQKLTVLSKMLHSEQGRNKGRAWVCSHIISSKLRWVVCVASQKPHLPSTSTYCVIENGHIQVHIALKYGLTKSRTTSHPMMISIGLYCF